MECEGSRAKIAHRATLNKTVGTPTIPVDDGRARFIEPALRSRLTLKKLLGDKIDPPIRNHLDHIVSGDESVSFFVMRSPISWNMVVRLEVQLRHCVFCMGPL